MNDALDLKRDAEQEALEQSVAEIIDDNRLLEFALVKGPLQEDEDWRRFWELLSELVEHGKDNRCTVDVQQTDQIVDVLNEFSRIVHALLREYVKGGGAG